MKKALLVLGVPLVLALGCSDSTTTRVTERTTTRLEPQARERTVIYSEPQSATQETIILEKPKPAERTTTYHSRTEVYEED